MGRTNWDVIQEHAAAYDEWLRSIFEPVRQQLGPYGPRALDLNESEARRLNKLTRGEKPGWPAASSMWWVAKLARRAGYSWCAGTLALFAAGRFKEFVMVMTTAKLSSDRKIEMLETVTSAAQPRIGEPWVDDSENILPSRSPKLKYYRRWQRQVHALKIRDACKPWILSPHEARAFDSSFARKPPLPNDPYVEIAAFIAGRYKFGMETQGTLIVGNLVEYLRHRGSAAKAR